MYDYVHVHASAILLTGSYCYKFGWAFKALIYYLPRRRRPGTGDIAMPPVRLSVHLSVHPSVCPSRLVFALMYFLETLQVRAPCHGGVLYSF